MNQSFYIGANGAAQQLLHLNVHGNNIANVNTYGFKNDKARFTQLLYEDVRAIDRAQQNGVGTQPSGVGTKMMMTSTEFTQRYVADTGRNTDYMIEGDGFFALVDLRTREISYTRDGSFTMSEFIKDTNRVDENGDPILKTVFCLSDGDGRFVLSDKGEIIEMENDDDPLPVGIYDFANYDGMLKVGKNRFMPVDKNGNVMMGDGILRQGMLEQSNTDLGEEFSKVIEAQRAYGLALKMVQTSDEIETTINSLRS